LALCFAEDFDARAPGASNSSGGANAPLGVPYKCGAAKTCD
jgi:hypothetical protein